MNIELQAKCKSWIAPGGINLIINVLSFLCVSVLAATGLLVLAHSHGSNTLLGFPKHSWGELHERFGVLMVLLVGYHLLRHRKWIAGLFKGQLLGDTVSRKRTLLTLGIALLVMTAIGTASLLDG
jgi:hypothetical protein